METGADRPTYRLGGYTEHEAPPDLRPYVERSWVYARPLDGPAIPGRGHRVLPESAVSLCFECERNGRGVVAGGRLVLFGPIARTRFFAPAPGLHLEAVSIRPEWCIDLLGTYPGEHEDAIQEYGLLERSRATAVLLDRLLRTTASCEAIGALLEWLRPRRPGVAPTGPAALAHAALERVRTAPGTTVRARSIACELGVSERHLRRIIRERTGHSAKRYHRILRLGRAVAAADQSRGIPNWSRLAVVAGFYDQPHLIREYRALVGLTPAETYLERASQRSPT